jgi:hypothetical protein
MEQALKAIQTRYKGYNFRSRLEARWAVFFDAIGIEWEYEVEGYDLGEKYGWYLPDFVVTSPFGDKYYYEIKPKNAGAEVKSKIEFFQKHINCYARVLEGDPYDVLTNTPNLNICPRCGLIGKPYAGSDYQSIGCEPCDLNTDFGVSDAVLSQIFLGVAVTPHKGTILIDDITANHFWKYIIFNAERARSARFEHGECGAT